MTTNNKTANRRDFIRSLLSTSVVGALGSVGQLALMREALAETPAFNDYKAMVCVFLSGGNDSFNMLVPNGDGTAESNPAGYANYQSIRGDLAVANTPLDYTLINDYHIDGSKESAYLGGVYPLNEKGIDLGVNAVMPELAKLVNENKASIIANIGNLVKPVTREGIENNTADLPLFLFAHNHQQRALQTGQGNNLNDIGWAGRIADNWTGVNSDSPIGLNVSYAGSDRMMIGNSSVPLAINSGTPPNFSNMEKDKNSVNDDRRSLFHALAGRENVSPPGKISFDPTNTPTTTDPFQAFYANASLKSMDSFELLEDAWEGHTVSYSRTDTYGNSLFSIPSSSQLDFDDGIGGGLIEEFEAIAKMIDIGVNNAFDGSEHNRQIFMVNLGGFDTHSGQATKHSLLLRELSLALSKFQAAMEEKGHENKVTTFTMSDFGRTMSNNGDGTDHAWGAHHIVIGGDGLNSAGNLKGGQMIGTLPDVTLDGVDDYSSKGRIIPTTAQDQLNATLCRWFGVDDALMPSVFPNLENFGTVSDDADSAYLKDLFV